MYSWIAIVKNKRFNRFWLPPQLSSSLLIIPSKCSVRTLFFPFLSFILMTKTSVCLFLIWLKHLLSRPPAKLKRIYDLYPYARNTLQHDTLLGCHVKWSDTLSLCLCVDQILNEHKHEHNISDTLTSTQQKSNLNIIQLMISDHYFRPNRKLFQMKLGWKLLCGAEIIRARLFVYPRIDGCQLRQRSRSCEWVTPSFLIADTFL